MEESPVNTPLKTAYPFDANDSLSGPSTSSGPFDSSGDRAGGHERGVHRTPSRMAPQAQPG